MKFEEMYIGQKIRVRTLDDMVSDPDLTYRLDKSFKVATIRSKDNTTHLSLIRKTMRYCGTAVTVFSLTENLAPTQRRHVYIEEDNQYYPWEPWMFEPIESKVDSDVFLNCLML